MLHFENGRFHQNGVSFALPDEFYFETCHDEDAAENGIRVLNRTKDYYVEWSIEEDPAGTEASLINLLRPDENPNVFISEIKGNQHNGLHGHQVYYTFPKDKKQYFEMRFALPDDMQFVFVIETKGDILALVQSEEIQSLIREIRAE